MATYQCQKNANNTNIIFRTIEGYNGTLNVYVMPNFETKCAELKSYAIKPLSLHMRTHYNENDSRPFSELQLRGTFSQAEIYNWIKCCIPEVPEKIEAEEITIYCFKNVLINTILICKFGLVILFLIIYRIMSEGYYFPDKERLDFEVITYLPYQF